MIPRYSLNDMSCKQIAPSLHGVVMLRSGRLRRAGSLASLTDQTQWTTSNFGASTNQALHLPRRRLITPSTGSKFRVEWISTKAHFRLVECCYLFACRATSRHQCKSWIVVFAMCEVICTTSFILLHDITCFFVLQENCIQKLASRCVIRRRTFTFVGNIT